MGNTFKQPKTQTEPEVEQPEARSFEKAETKGMPKPVGALMSVLGGSILTRETVIKQIPFVLFLAFVAMLYIANGYYAESMVKEINQINNDIKELKSEYITTKSDLMHVSKQSEVAKAAAVLELKESTTPPKKIIDNTSPTKTEE